MKLYDYLIVGAGLYGCVFAHEAKQRGKRCLVVDRRLHVGGNVYCEDVDGIHVHKYGAHIFHTADKEVWRYVNRFVEFNRYTNSPVANYQGRLYNLPFNMNTFYQLWGVKTPQEAEEKLAEQRAEYADIEPKNLEEQALKLIGRDVYETLVKGYTEKQWGCSAKELPPFIIKRLPVRLVFDNNYFNDPYQGIPVGGYNQLVNALLEGVEVKLNVDFCKERAQLEALAHKVLYTGMLDELFDYQLGELQYRSLRFEHQRLEMPNYQGNAVVNYTEREVPYTRVIEHKHFEMFGAEVDNCPKTVISREYSSEWTEGSEPYYPVNDERNNALYQKYKELADKETNVVFGGRLAEYKYYDMHHIVEKALRCFES